MIKYLKYLTLFILSLFVIDSIAQSENFRSRSSFGFMVGGSYYIGDLNQFHHFRRTNLSAGAIYRYYINSRIALRGAFRYGTVEGYDSDSNNDLQINRNLSFQSDIYELTGGIEFNYKNYKLGNSDHFFSPYLFIDIGVFRMNPTTEYNGEQIELQPIGTEGQGSSLSEKDQYNLTQLVVPLGVGFKINLGQRAAVSFEYGIRKTFTDYLDDVGEGNYIQPDLLAQENGDIAARLSDRSLSENPMVGSRGNSATKDWYSMFGVMLTFSLGDPDKCFYH
tara:strand:- start:100126 stop:100959 length:834 start_codon:yes stop_codon:yes gene_type:complete